MNSALFLRRFVQPAMRSMNLISMRLTSSTVDPEFKSKIDEFIKANKIAIFIKGEPDAPRCGFSKAVLQILDLHGCDFKSKNILDDEQLRQNMKIYSNWPTFPQVYFNGEFVGGCDILHGMHQSGELIDELKKIGIQSKLSDVETKDTSASN